MQLPRIKPLQRLVLTMLLIAFSVLAVAIGIASWYPLRTVTPPAKPAGSFRLVDFNIAHGRGLAFDQNFVFDSRIARNLHLLGSYLDSTHADIVTLQEIDQNSTWNGNVDQLKLLGGATHLGHEAMGLNCIREGRFQLNYGNGTLARYPITRTVTQRFGNARFGQKGFLYTRIDLDGTPFDLINVHLDFRRRSTRVHQIDQLIDWVNAQRREHPDSFVAPVITGDFNCELIRADDGARHLLDYLQTLDTYTVMPHAQHTFPTYDPKRNFDHVFVPSIWSVTQITVPQVRLSDHLPVILDFAPRVTAARAAAVTPQ